MQKKISIVSDILHPIGAVSAFDALGVELFYGIARISSLKKKVIWKRQLPDFTFALYFRTYVCYILKWNTCLHESDPLGLDFFVN